MSQKLKALNMTNNGVDFYIKKAIEIAKKSEYDLPIGCVITDLEGNIISSAHNEKEKNCDVTSHAEILAIKKASEKLSNWRLSNCKLYVTLEPCPMCAWAILNSRIPYVYYGASDNLYGAFDGKIDLRKLLNTKIEVRGGFLEEECENLLKKYFEGIRK